MTITKHFNLFFIFFSGSLFASDLIPQIEPPWGYVFNNWDGPPLNVIIYIPKEATTQTPILMVVPGASRDAQRFHASWLDLAKKYKFTVVTIGATKNYFPDEYSYNAGRVISKEGYAMHEKQWLFSAIEPLFQDIKERYGFSSKKFYLFGHSAGGGIVHRFLLFKPNAPVVRAVAANPAFVTLPNKLIGYPFGIKNTPINKGDVKKWLGHKMAIVLGESDLGPRTQPLSNGLMAKKQGPNCFTRGTLLYDMGKERASQDKTDFGWSLVTVPNVGHDNYNIAPAACEFLFGNELK
jgi:hypothetical protein